MIEHLHDTTVSAIARRLVQLRAEGGATTLGRVLTLVILSTGTGVEEAIAAANFASQEHPMRIIALALDASEPTADRLEAEIRVGSDAGAGDVIVLRPAGAVADDPERLVAGLLLADAPVVVWWADLWPVDGAESPFSHPAQRRITDSGAFDDPLTRLSSLSESYRPGDTDLAWSRLTLWRAQLASALDNAPGRPVTGVTVRGTNDSSSTLLLAAWLRMQLQVPVRHVDLPALAGTPWGIHSVTIHSDEGDTEVGRSHGPFVAITQPGHPRLEVPLPRRARSQCLAEDLRLLRPDALYGRVMTVGLPLLLAEPAPASPAGGLE